jgi:hypothetical protein
MKKVKFVDLVFENCEFARLKPNMFSGLAISGIQKNYIINCCQYKKGECLEDISCESFRIMINNEGLKNAEFTDALDKNETLRDRLNKFKDITHINLVFSDNKKEYIQVPWKGDYDSNELQVHEPGTERGEIKIVCREEYIK